MVSFRARVFDAMVMFTTDTLMAPVTAGTMRGPKYSRLLVDPKKRVAQRNIAQVSANVLDVLPVGSNHNDGEACDLTVNVYARTRLRYSLVADNVRAAVGDSISVNLQADVLQGNAATGRALARMVSPATDIAALAPRLKLRRMNLDSLNRDQQTPRFDTARALAELEKSDRKISGHVDQQMKVAIHGEGPLHIHLEKAPVAGAYNLAVYIEGDYCPEHDSMDAPGSHDHSATTHTHGGGGGGSTSSTKCGPGCVRESFTRLLTTQLPVTGSAQRATPAVQATRTQKKGRKAKTKR